MAMILVLGKGFLGKRIAGALHCKISDARIRSFFDAEKIIRKHKPKIIINCIGKSGRNTDDCELYKDKTLFANSFIPVILAEAALRSRIKLIHISSGCLFDYDFEKDKPITEEKVPDFLELFYSRSKIYPEIPLSLLSAKKLNCLILRVRLPLDNRPHPKNLLDKLIRYKKVIDLPNSITYIPDFLNALKHLIKIDARGIFNIVNSGGLFYNELMDVYKRYDPDFEYKTVKFKDLGLVRTNLLLSVRKLGKTGFNMRPAGEVIEECVREYLKRK
ncbi:MAG: sugar nucleotide-binding protein [Candidatus Omnitrophica bacterium]|nr:sugar nucleotide-binding protein [Candidatus Omnitrophota bacterium]